jgi:hypothetical protein
MSEKLNKSNPGKPNLRKTVVKDMPLRTGKAGKVKGGALVKGEPPTTELQKWCSGPI